VDSVGYHKTRNFIIHTGHIGYLWKGRYDELDM